MKKEDGNPAPLYSAPFLHWYRTSGKALASFTHSPPEPHLQVGPVPREPELRLQGAPPPGSPAAGNAPRVAFGRRGWLGSQPAPRAVCPFSLNFQALHLPWPDSQTLVSKAGESGPRQRGRGGHGAYSQRLCAPPPANLLAAPLPAAFGPAPLRPWREVTPSEA